MPNRDQTGPEGIGPQTGLQEGDCADNDAPRSAIAALGRGWGRRRGRMRRNLRARRFGRGSRLTQEQKVASLKDKAAWLKEQLDAVNQRLEEVKE